MHTDEKRKEKKNRIRKRLLVIEKALKVFFKSERRGRVRLKIFIVDFPYYDPPILRCLK